MNRNKLSPDFLIETTQKENVYLLGFLWADGWIQNTKYTHIVSMSIVKDDFLMIEPLLRKYGVESFHERQRYMNGRIFGRISRSFTIQSKTIVNFLLENDYDKKSGYSPTKILSIIPENLHHYFWRGYLDGDGCISSKRNKCEIAFWSVSEQDWTDLLKLTKKLGLVCQIYKYSRKNGKHLSSVFRMGGIDNIISFCNYIYKDYDNIGLERKYKKYLELIPIQKIIRRKTSRHVGVFLARRTGRWGARFYDKKTKTSIHLGWHSTEALAIDTMLGFLQKNQVV